MEQDLSTSLPQELIMDILWRLPIPSIIQSKLVCKPWLDFIESREFARFHLSKSVPGLAVGHDDTEEYEFHEFVEDEVDCNHKQSVAAFNFSLPYNAPILFCSVDGLLFMRKDLFICNKITRDIIICNSITRDYIVLPRPEYSGNITYGFGVSKISRQYKVVMISRDGDESSTQPPKCEVYTLGTGSWRSIVGSCECPSTIKYDRDDEAGAFVNGNLHWRGSRWGEDGEDHHICCFDLETERFSTFYSPPSCNAARLTALEDCLCLFHKSGRYYEQWDPYESDIIIWLLKEYGDEKSWTNKLKHKEVERGVYVPIKVFKDGDILMSLQGSYSVITWSSRLSYWDSETSELVYTPSFLSLKTFAMDENVSLY